MQPRKSDLAAALFAVVLLFTPAARADLKVGDDAPDLTAFKLEGKLPETLKDKVVLLDFWASWCYPCRESFPVMEELQKRYGNRGFVVIAISVDEKKADMEEFLRKNAVTFAIVRDARQKLVARAGVAAMPSSFLIDRAGRVRFAHSGFRGAETKKKYQEEIESLLKH